MRQNGLGNEQGASKAASVGEVAECLGVPVRTLYQWRYKGVGPAGVRVGRPAVAAWVAEMRARGLSASRIRQAYRVLSSLMAAAVRGGYIGRTPCTGIRLPRAARRDAALLTASEVDRLAEAAGEYGTLIYLLAYGGLRWGEVAALRRRRCDLLRRRVEVAEAASDVNGRLVYGPTKTFERRWVRLPDFLVERLARQLEGVGPDNDEFVRQPPRRRRRRPGGPSSDTWGTGT